MNESRVVDTTIYDFAPTILKLFGLDESLIIPSRMSEINWIAKRPRDSSLDASKATKYLNEKPYTLSRALKILKEEVV